METGCARSTTLTAPPSVWALLAFALTTLLCLAFDSSFGVGYMHYPSPLLTDTKGVGWHGVNAGDSSIDGGVQGRKLLWSMTQALYNR
ncbi:g7452 [Coccomyxa viridis]|uniref:G7452 protein n=1 Tax=Coccomyxa viridis TaxID=1274662 RepID=A0ABP1FXV6_9CHLO